MNQFQGEPLNPIVKEKPKKKHLKDEDLFVKSKKNLNKISSNTTKKNVKYHRKDKIKQGESKTIKLKRVPKQIKQVKFPNEKRQERLNRLLKKYK